MVGIGLVLVLVHSSIMGRNRLEELQKASKHGQVTEEEEMAPLNKAKKKKKGSKPPPAGLDEDFQDFMDRFQEVAQDIDKVKENVEEIRNIQKRILTSTHREEQEENRSGKGTIRDLCACVYS